MVRFAMIGTGFICDEFLEAALQIPEFSLTALYTRNRETGEKFLQKNEVLTSGKGQQDREGVRIFTDLEELACSDIADAVYIASPNSLHLMQSILMLEHGKHVICEKPAASNAEELSRMLSAAEKNGLVFLEAMRPVFDPGFEEIVKHLPELGTVRRVTFQYGKYSSRYDKFRNGQILNAFNPSLSNAAVMDIGVYCIHVLVRLFGLPKDVKVQSIFLENGMEGSGTVLADYGAMQAELIYSKITDNYLPSQIQGEEGTMVIREICDTAEILMYPRNGEMQRIGIDKKENNMYYEIQEFITLIEENARSGGRETERASHHNQFSRMEMQLMDEVRRKGNIRFSKDDPLFADESLRH